MLSQVGVLKLWKREVLNRERGGGERAHSLLSVRKGRDQETLDLCAGSWGDGRGQGENLESEGRGVVKQASYVCVSYAAKLKRTCFLH